MTFTVGQLFQLFVAMCGSFATIAGAIAIIMKVIHRARKPSEERDELLKRHTDMLDRDNKRLRELEEGNKVIMQSMLALMSHELDGNHTEQLRKAKEDLEEYLIRR